MEKIEKTFSQESNGEGFQGRGLSEEEFQQLIELRKQQITGPWNEEKRYKLNQLERRLKIFGRESEPEKETGPLSPKELEEYRLLTRKQLEARPGEWYPENARRLQQLQARLDEYGTTENPKK